MAFGYPTPKSQFSYDLISIFLRTGFGANLNLISKTFLLTPLPTCALTMYVLLSRFLGSRPWKIALSFGYAVNGFATTIFLTGTAAILTVAAVFPLFLLVSLRFFEGQFPAKSLLSASKLLAIAMSFNMQANSWFMLFVPIAAVVILCERGKAGILLRGLLFAAGLTTIAFLLLLPALLVPITSAIGGKTATALVGYTPSAVNGTIKSFYLSFTNLNNLYFLEGMMVVISILGLFLDWSRHSRELRYWSLLLITAGLLTLLVMLVLSNWTPSQAFAILIFYSFDYPQLLMFVTAWALVLLLALLVFQTSLERNKVKRKVLNAVIALVLLS